MVSLTSADRVPDTAPPPFETVNTTGSDAEPRTTAPKLCIGGSTLMAAGLSTKVAVTGLSAATRFMRHFVMPAHGGDQSPKVCSASGVAVSSTGDSENVAMHDAPHEMPGWSDATVPPPALVTDSVAV